MKKEKQAPKKKKRLDIYRDINTAIKVARVNTDAKHANRLIILAVLVSIFILENYIFFYYYFYQGYTPAYVAVAAIAALLFGSILGYFIYWVIFLFVLDYLKLRRKKEIEKILPEFFRLVAANHRSGLSFEKALWKANKPRFGILSQEIEIVAKTTYARGNLVVALEEFSEKYDSKLLKRFISILSKGLKTGSNLSDLLDDIASNATKIMNTRKDLATDVMNYIFFILVAVMLICPFMFGIGHQLTKNVHTLKSKLNVEDLSTVPTAQFSSTLQTKAATVDTSFFNKFAIMMIMSNCIISVLMISILLHGNLIYNITKIPLVLIFSYAVYFTIKSVMAIFLAIT